MSTNRNIVMIVGRAAAGKSSSLYELKDQEKYIYLNCDRKDIPFEHNFMKDIWVDDPEHIFTYIDRIEANDDVQGGVIDTLTILMEMYETMHVLTAADSRSAWGCYGQFYKRLMNAIKAGKKDYIVLSHVDNKLNPETGSIEDYVPVKGALAKRGIAADWTHILTTLVVPASQVKDRENEYLTITEEDEEDGIKRVFQTRLFKGDGYLSRSPMKFWTRDELYINPDINTVLDRIKSKRK